MLWVSEHGRIFLAETDESLPDGNLLLRKKNFEALLSLIEDQDDQSQDYSPIFTYLRPAGRPQLKVQNYVGVIRVADGTQVEVLPKISKRMDLQTSRDLLVRMLIELEESPFFEGNAADLQAHQMPLFELLMRCFLDHVVTIVRKGIARTYVPQQENLVFLRGKLQMSEHVRRNSFNSTRAFCEFDEYEADRPINRLIKGALEVVEKLTREPTNQQRCRELLFWFERVPASGDPRSDFQHVRRDRLVQHYSPAMPLCRLILEHLNPLTQQGESQTVSMLFPMERVFEDFVAAKLRDQLVGWQVATQATGQALVDRHLGKKMFNLRPDLLFSRGAQRVIGDTKWKLISEKDRGGNYKISQADIYQLFAYSRKYLKNHAYREVLLIYPASDAFTEPLEPFWYQEGIEVLWVVPYDLENETLVLPEASSLNQYDLELAVV